MFEESDFPVIRWATELAMREAQAGYTGGKRMSSETKMMEHPINPEELQDIVEHQGVLAHRGGSGAIDFQFTYLGFPFAVRAEAGARGATVNIRAVLGYLPYTSESRRGRLGAMQILQASAQVLGQRVHLGDKQRLIMSDKRSTKDTLTPVNLMALMVGMLLEAKPYLELLANYVIPAGGGGDSEDDLESAGEIAAPALI